MSRLSTVCTTDRPSWVNTHTESWLIGESSIHTATPSSPMRCSLSRLEDDRFAPGEPHHLAPVQHRPVGRDVKGQLHRQSGEEVGVEVIEVLVGHDEPGDPAPVPVEEVVIAGELEPGGVEGAAGRKPGVHQQMGVAGGERETRVPQELDLHVPPVST